MVRKVLVLTSMTCGELFSPVPSTSSIFVRRFLSYFEPQVVGVCEDGSTQHAQKDQENNQ